MTPILLMGTLISIAALPVIGDATSTKAVSTDQKSTENVDDTITYLLDYVLKSELTIIRNGDSHTGVEASVHFKAKYEHFKNAIRTPEDFIQLAATKSMVTGKPYLVKQLDGKEISCAEWLGKILANYRKR
jgi:hypothetical protein